MIGAISVIDDNEVNVLLNIDLNTWEEVGEYAEVHGLSISQSLIRAWEWFSAEGYDGHDSWKYQYDNRDDNKDFDVEDEEWEVQGD